MYTVDHFPISEKSDAIVARLERALLQKERELFKLWHRFKNKEITRAQLQKNYISIRQRVGELLERGKYTAPELKITQFCQNLLEDFEALWPFIEVEGIEPTNNHSERGVRHLVIWRKKYFAVRSDVGSEFMARTGSLLMTCKLQSRNSFEFLI